MKTWHASLPYAPARFVRRLASLAACCASFLALPSSATPLPQTATTLAITAGGASVTSVPPGTVIALSATVTSSAAPVTSGQVNFCDASAVDCTDVHLLGSVSLSANGTATFKFVPGAGTHSYKAMFLQGGSGLASASAASSLTVDPAPAPVYSSTTAVGYGGTAGDWDFTATVVGYGGTAAPTGNISFLDTSFANASLGTAPLGAATPGFGWLVSQTSTLASHPVSQVTGDFNGDGVTDLLVLSGSSGEQRNLNALFGKGDGTFTAGPVTPSAMYSELGYPMVAADFNGDGKTDLAILIFDMSQSQNLVVYLGNGDGTFAAPATTVVDNTIRGGDGIPGSLIAVDLNGDGKIDLAAVGACFDVGGASILLGNGDGTFTATAAKLLPDHGFNLIGSGDFNGDRIPDLIVTDNFGPQSALVLLGKGDGTFAATAPIPIGTFTSSVVVGDFNQDGKIDAAIGTDNSVLILLGNGDGTLEQTAAGTMQGDPGRQLLAGDFNRDGKADLAAFDTSNDLIDLYLGAGDGTFQFVTTTPKVSGGPSSPFSLVAGDFNEDGVPDLSMLVDLQATASILLSAPTQTATATVRGITPVGAGTHNIVAGYAGDADYGATVSSPTSLSATLAPVVPSPAAGTYTSALTVTLNEIVPGATIFYSLTGTAQTNGMVPYTGPIQLSSGGIETLQAYATEDGYQNSNSVQAAYYLNLPSLPAPILSPAGGTYVGSQSVTMTDAAPGTTFFYTTDGTTPTAASARYTGPITLSSSATVSAIAVGSGYTASAPATARYLIASSGTSLIYTIAGSGRAGYHGDGGPGTAAQLNLPAGIVRDAAGNLYIADQSNHVVRKIAASSGVITTFAGTGTSGYTGDDGPALSAQLSFPGALALDGAGNLYIADSGNHVVREVEPATGVIRTIAGTGISGSSGDGGPASGAQLAEPMGFAFDGAGNLYVADASAANVRRIAAQSGVITTVAGSGSVGYSGDGAAATSAQLYRPVGLALDTAGNLYIADSYNNVIRKVTASNGIISTVAGNGYAAGQNDPGGYTGDGGPAVSAELYEPQAVALDSAGNLYLADTYNHVIRMVGASSGVISTVAGNGSVCRSQGGDGGPATNAALCYPLGIWLDASGNLYIADSAADRIREVSASSLPATAQTAAPVFNVAGGTYALPQTVTITDSTPGAAIYVTLDGSAPSTAAQGYQGPITVSSNLTIQAIAVAPGFVASPPRTAAYVVTLPPAAVITTAAGNGVSGFSDGGSEPASAHFGSPAEVATDASGDVFFADSVDHVVWKLTAQTGRVSVVAGTGVQTSGLNPGPAPATTIGLDGPSGIAVDSAGNLYIADTNNNVVRKVASGSGLMTVYAGTGGLGTPLADTGDGGPATSARLGLPGGLAVDQAGNLYIADYLNNRVRMVNAATGVITTVAGHGANGSTATGDGGPATSATLYQPLAVALDNNGNLYIATGNPTVVRKVASSSGVITTVAGNGNYRGSSGDGGPATQAEVFPSGVAVDSAGNLYLSEPAAIRQVSAGTGLISTVVGIGYTGFNGDGGSPLVAQLDQPGGLAFDAAGNLYIADSNNHRLRKVSGPLHALATPTVGLTPSAASVSSAQAFSVAVVVSATGATPTGSVTLSSGGYQAQQVLANGAVTFNVAAEALDLGPNTLTATYQPDSASAGLYETASQSTTVTVTDSTGAAVATVAVTPSATNITDQQGATASVSVMGDADQAAPTGTVTLSGGSFISQQTLTGGSARFELPPGALAAGTDTLTANYAGDAHYGPAKGTATIQVNAVVLAVAVPSPIAPGSTATATASLSAGSKYAGTMNLGCSLIASPAGAQSVPTCSVNPASVTITAGGTATTTVTVHTTASAQGSAQRHDRRDGPSWTAWSGGGVLVALMFGFPFRRRKVALILVMVCGICAFTGCGGGGNHVPPNTTPGTTAGLYTFRVVGTDTSNPDLTVSANLTLTVQ